MAEPLKTFFSPALVGSLAASLVRVRPDFPAPAFVADATRGLEALGLMDRARQISAALARHLPPRYEDALAVLLASLGPEHASDELEGAGMAPFFYLPHVLFVAERGLDDFERSMAAQHALTRRFTAEFSIRPFLAGAPDRTLARLAEWTADPSPHVRRLVSEGTRPRLPWAPRVPFLESNPQRTLPLLERLKDDPAPLVRRSVANHLNDLGKSRPDLLIETCRRWLRGATPERRALVEHALRSAVKRGDPDALALLGHGAAPLVRLEATRCEPARPSVGDAVRVTFALRSTAAAAQALLVDLAVHFVKARGHTRAKVFKVARVELPPRGRVELSKSISLAVHTTRTPFPGVHALEAILNGVPYPLGSFELLPAPLAPRPRSP